MSKPSSPSNPADAASEFVDTAIETATDLIDSFLPGSSSESDDEED